MQDPLKANLILASYQLSVHIQWDFCTRADKKYMSQNGANEAGNLWQENPLATQGRTELNNVLHVVTVKRLS